MSAENELATIYELMGEKVGNTNLPRNLTQFKIELAKLSKVEWDKFAFEPHDVDSYKECIKHLHKVVDEKNREIKNVITEINGKNKHIVYLQNRIDELTLNHKIYQKKIDDLKCMIEDNDVSEFTQKIMDDAERDIVNAKEEGRIYKSVSNHMGLIIRHFILEHIKIGNTEGYEFCEDGIDCSRINHLGHLIQSELETMNDEDWNGDGKESYLIYEDDTIKFRHTDWSEESSEEDSDSD
jgi:hypothetical protein